MNSTAAPRTTRWLSIDDAHLAQTAPNAVGYRDQGEASCTNELKAVVPFRQVREH